MRRTITKKIFSPEKPCHSRGETLSYDKDIKSSDDPGFMDI